MLDPTGKDREDWAPPPTIWRAWRYTTPAHMHNAHALPTLLFPIFSFFCTCKAQSREECSQLRMLSAKKSIYFPVVIQSAWESSGMHVVARWGSVHLNNYAWTKRYNSCSLFSFLLSSLGETRSGGALPLFFRADFMDINSCIILCIHLISATRLSSWIDCTAWCIKSKWRHWSWWSC